MANHPHVHGAGRAIKFLFTDLPPLENKNPYVAAILGFFLGGLGLGVYFQSWKDFAYPILVAVIAVLAWGTFIPVVGAGIGIFLTSLCLAIFGFWRAANSTKS